MAAYWNTDTGRVHVRESAGGTGGGVTSSADRPATTHEHFAFLRDNVADLKARLEAAIELHDAEVRRHNEANPDAPRAEIKPAAKVPAPAHETFVNEPIFSGTPPLGEPERFPPPEPAPAVPEAAPAAAEPAAPIPAAPPIVPPETPPTIGA